MNASQLTIIINILVHNKSHKKVHNILCQEISFTLLGFLSLNRTKNWFGDADQYFLMFFQFLQGIAPQGSDDIYGPKFQLNPMKFQKGHLISKGPFPVPKTVAHLLTSTQMLCPKHPVLTIMVGKSMRSGYDGMHKKPALGCSNRDSQFCSF